MIESPDDVQTMTRLAEGDAAAWDSLYRRYRERVWRYVARATGGDADLVGDLVQETFLEAARGARKYDSARGAPATWLLGIAHRRVAERWRKTYRDRRHREAYATEIPQRPHSGTSEASLRDGAVGLSQPERRLADKERADALREALASLPGDYAELLAEKYFDDATLEQLAQSRGETAAAASSRLARARDALRQALRRILPGEFETDRKGVLGKPADRAETDRHDDTETDDARSPETSADEHSVGDLRERRDRD